MGEKKSLSEIKDRLLHTQWTGIQFEEYDLPVKALSGNFKKGLSLPITPYRTKGVYDNFVKIIKTIHEIPDDIQISTVIRGEYKIKPNTGGNIMYREFVENMDGDDFLLHVIHPEPMQFSTFDRIGDMHLIEMFSKEQFAAMGTVAWSEFGLVPLNDLPDHDGTLHGKLVVRNTLDRASEKEHQEWLKENNLKELQGIDDLRVYVNPEAPIALLPNIRNMWLPLMRDFAPHIKASEEVVTQAAILGQYSIGRAGNGKDVHTLNTAITDSKYSSYLVKMSLPKPAAYSRETYEIMRTELDKTAELFVKFNKVGGIRVLDFEMDSMSERNGYVAGYPTIYFTAPKSSME